MYAVSEYEIQSIKRQWDAGVPIFKIIRSMPMQKKYATSTLSQLRREGVLPPRKKKRGREIVIEAYKSGIHNPYTIAEMYGYALNSVRSWLSTAKLNRPKFENGTKWKSTSPSEKTKKIIQCLEKGIRTAEIAKMFNVSTQWVYEIKSKRSKKND